MKTPQITRTAGRGYPTLRLRHEWRHRGHSSTHGYRQLEVVALYSHNEDDFPDPYRADGHQLPNEITVELATGESRSKSTIRLSRAGAEALQIMIDEALRWDGVTP